MFSHGMLKLFPPDILLEQTDFAGGEVTSLEVDNVTDLVYLLSAGGSLLC